ncbi:MAG: thiamine pyrophosphate-binding protein [Gammaproteobacteria bacterium]|nr:thiamine pyrophosphate-binding protein [Gammaproteobacteria bacterium]
MVVNTTEAQNPQHTPELGDLLVQYLKQLKVEYVFGVPGGAIEPLYNALARSERKNGPRPITARHETGAAFMAEGYTRQTGIMGVCCATTGPGTTNLITGVASAYENQIPMLVISAQTALPHFGRGALQDSSCSGINTVAMMHHCTRHSTLISHVKQFEEKLVTAIMTAHQAPNGPVHLSVPSDIMRAYAPTPIPTYDLPSLIRNGSVSDLNAIERFCSLLERKNNIVFVIGPDCSQAVAKILELAKRIDAKVVTTPDGKGLVSPYHPLYRGVTGFAGHDSASELLSDSETELIVAIGTNLGEWATGGWNHHTILNNRLVHIQASDDKLTRSPMAQLHIQGQLRIIFDNTLKHFQGNQLSEIIEPETERQSAQEEKDKVVPISDFKLPFRMRDEFKCYNDKTPIKPQRLMRLLTELFPPQTCYIADNGNSCAWAIHYLQPFERRISGKRCYRSGLFCMCQGFYSMGWAIGVAIGMSFADRKRPTVCITGDGSLLMSGHEISVAVQECLPVIFVILNDSSYGMVKHGQLLGQAESTSFKLNQVDFATYANSIGATGIQITTGEELKAVDIDAALSRPGPTVLDIQIDIQEIPPISSRVFVLNNNA